MNYDMVVSSIVPRLPADRAGILLGDSIDIAATPNRYKQSAFQGETLPGGRATLAVVQSKSRRFVTLVSEPESSTPADKMRLALRLLAGIIFFAIGGWLAWVRPTPTTLGFYLFCVGVNPAPDHVLGLTFTYPWNQAVDILGDLVLVAGILGILIFALGFPEDDFSGWRHACYRLMPWFFVIYAVIFEYADLGPVILGVRTSQIDNVSFVIAVLIVFIAVYAVVQRYFTTDSRDRQRIRWVVWGFAIALLIEVTEYLFIIRAMYPNSALYGILTIIPIILPLTVAYAVIHNRVIDVRFAISRAIVYGMLTSLLVAIFAIIDWLFVRRLINTDLGIAVELGVAIAVGFWLNALHHRVDQLVDRVFFQHRYAAALRLERVAHAIPHAPSEEAVNRLVTVEPMDALGLTSAAIFRVAGDGSYLRREAIQWPADSVLSLPLTDTLVLHLQAEQTPLKVAQLHWRRTDIPGDACAPMLGIPFLIRRRVVAIALYGGHVSGADFDPDEIRLLERVGDAAGSAYDHIEAESLRHENQILRERLRAAGQPLQAFE